jgi:hypothetical protein
MYALPTSTRKKPDQFVNIFFDIIAANINFQLIKICFVKMSALHSERIFRPAMAEEENRSIFPVQFCALFFH